MKHITPNSNSGNARTLIAGLLSYVLLASQLTPLALAVNSSRHSAPATRNATEIQPIVNGAPAAPAPVPVPLLFVPNITATKTDNIPQATKVNPGDIITYSITINNSGTDATNVTLNDTVDPNTTIIGGSVKSGPIAFNDAYSAIGNVRIQVPDGASDLLANDVDPDTGTNAGLTVTTLAGDNSAPFSGTSTQGGQVTATTGDGSFEYNPAPGFTGTDTFTYTITDSEGGTSTATVTLTVTSTIWFVNSAAAPGGDGRLTTPFNCLVGAGCFDPVAADDPGDNIFLFSGAYPDTAGLTLLNNQKLIGQGASQTLATIAGVTVPTFSDALPATGGANPTITSSANGINIGVGNSNTLRGFTIGNTTGTKIASGASFATLTLGNNAIPDLLLNGTGQALNLTNGTFAATSAFSSVTTTSSTAQGISLIQVAGTLALGSTTVSGSTTQGIFVNQSTANINFGNTSVTGGTDAVSLQNNSAGTRTFGTLSTTNNSGVGFLHAVGGGITTAGTTTITNPGGIGISIANSTTAVTFGNTTSTLSGGTGVSLTGSTAGGTVTFADLDISPDANQQGLVASANLGTITSTSGTVVTTGASAISVTTSPLALVFDSVSASGGSTAGVSLTTASGSIVMNAGTLTGNATVAPFVVTGGTVSATFSGGITQANNVAMISITGGHATGTITFQTGTLNATNGTGLQFDNADGVYNFNGTTTLNGGDAGVDIVNGSGGTFTFASGTSINNPSGVAYREDTSTATVNYNGTITKTNNANNAVDINAKTGGATTFSGAISATTTTANAIDLTNTGGTVTFRGGLVVSTTSGIGFNATGAGTTVNVCDENPCAPAATGALVNTLTSTTGTALNVANTTIGANKLEFRSISSNGAPNGINLNNTGAGGLTVTGNGSTCTLGTPTCDGGSIQSSTGAGISLTSAANVSLTRMKIQNSGTDGIATSGVNGFTLDNSIVTDSAGALTDEGLQLFNTSGTLTITNSAISNAPDHQIFVDNNNTNMTSFVMTNTTAQCVVGNTCQPAGSIGEQGLLIQVRGTSVLTSGSVTGCTFSGVRSTGVQVFTADTGRIGSSAGGAIVAPAASNSFTVQTSTFTNNNIAIDFSQSQVSNFAFQILNNTTITGNNSHAINVATAAGAGTGPASHAMVGKIDGNAIGTQGVKDSGSRIGNGLRVFMQGANTQASIFVNNNTIREVSNADIMTFTSQNGAATSGSGTARFKITNNSLPLPSGSNQALCGPANTPCAGNGIFVLADEGDPACNIITGNNIFDINGYSPLSGPFDVYLAERTGPPAGAQLTVEGTGGSNSVFIQANNTLAGSSKFIDEGGNTSQVAPGACGTFPTFVGLGIVSPERVPDNVKSSASAQQTEVAMTVAPAAPNPLAVQNTASLERTTESAVHDASTSKQLDFNKPKREGVTIARYAKNDAWLSRASQPIAAQQEQGRISKPTEKITLSAPVIVGDNITWNIGTLPAGQSVTITFQVQVDNPFTGPGQVSNQGTISNDSSPSVLTDDPDAAGVNNPTITLVNAPPNVNVNDAKAPEPAAGTAPMVFTVALSAPAGVAGATVHYATADQAPGPGHAEAGLDYTAVPDTVLTFASGEQVKTVSVSILSDALVEPDETFLLNLSNPTGCVIVDGQAVGTITQNLAGTFLISELRTSGPGGPGDDFVELYNNTDSSLTVAASDASAGYGVFKTGVDCNATPVLVATIPNGTIIPARGHYLLVGPTYGLAANAAGNQTVADIASDSNVAVFSTANVLNVSSANRLDAVGFGTNTTGVCALLEEGTTIPANGPSALEHSFLRDPCGKGGNPATFGACPSLGKPVDFNNNVTDFIFADTASTPTLAGQHLGAPGPENLASPIERNSTIDTVFLDATKAGSVAPNRTRDFTPVTNGANGTLSIRRRFINSTGASLTRLRFRIIDMDSTPVPAGIADVRALSSLLVVVTGVMDPATCLASTGSSTVPCTVNVQGTTLETPPAQALGGALNSTMAAGTVTLGTPLANGASINLQFLLGVQTPGLFKFFINIEALP